MQYSSAILAYDELLFGGASQVAQFVERHSSRFDKLKVKHRKGQQPMLKMIRHEGSDNFDVYQWKQDDLVDFLHERLSEHIQ